ncbi:MAG TPA: GIY-YIG nuclease family protein [Polyangia bacterium]|nr:GIY-YIG nuclease family protein [Polyangia bacterium]
MTWSVYLARCADDTLYCGIARNVEARLAAHSTGRGARYTRGRGPVVLLAAHRYRDQGTALRIELAIKRLPRAQKLAIALDRRRWAAVARRVGDRRQTPDM